MSIRHISVGLLAVVVVGLFSVNFPSGIVSGSAAENAAPTAIDLGEYFFGAPANMAPVGDAAKPEKVVATITGAATGEIVLVLKNVGQLEHEVLSPLFLATSEAAVKSFDAKGNEISKVETVGSLREVALQAGMSAEVTLALDEPLQRAFEDDPNLTMTFEISCQVGHKKRDTAKDHYQLGMRGLIVLKP